MLSVPAAAPKTNLDPVTKPGRFVPNVEPGGEDSLAMFRQHLNAYMDYVRYERDCNGLTARSVYSPQEEFEAILPDRDWLENKIINRLYDIRFRISSKDLSEPAWLQKSFGDLCYVLTIIIRTARRQFFEWINERMWIWELFRSLDELCSLSEESNYVAFAIVQDILLQTEPLSSSNIPLILQVGIGSNVTKFPNILQHVSFATAAMDPSYLVLQQIREMRNCLRAKLKTYDNSSATPVIQRIAWFYHDMSVVHVRRPVVELLFRRLVPTELAAFIAEADIANYHPRLITKGLNTIYTLDDGPPDSLPKCECEGKKTEALTNMYIQDGGWLTCPQLVDRGNCYFSGYLRGLKHDHLILQDKPYHTLVSNEDPVNAFTKPYTCRLPLDECPGHFEASDSSWMLSREEQKAMQNAEKVLGGSNGFYDS